MKIRQMLVAYIMIMTVLIPVLPIMKQVPTASGQPPLTGDWVISTAESLTGGTYEVHNGDLVIQNGGTLTLDGTEIRMDDTTGPQYYVEVQRGGTLIMRNDALIRSEQNGSNFYLFYMWEGAKVRISNSNISDVGDTNWGWYDQGIYIQSDDVVIDNSDITRGGHGLRIIMCSPTITNNTIYNNSGYGIHVEEGSPYIYNNDIIDNGFGGPWWAEWHGIFAYNSKSKIVNNQIINNGWNGGGWGNGMRIANGDVLVANNTISDNRDYGITIDNHVSGKFADNDIIDNGGGGIYVFDHSDVEIVRNTVRSQNSRALQVQDGSSPVIRDNLFNTTGNTQTVYITDFSAPVMSENTIHNTGGEHGIYLTGFSKPVLEDNTISKWGGNNGDNAIVSNDNTQPTLRGNTIYCEFGRGIDITHWVEAVIEDNAIDAGDVALYANDFSKLVVRNTDLLSRDGNGLMIGYYSQAYIEDITVDSRWEGIEIWSFTDVEVYNGTVNSRQDNALEVRYMSDVLFEGLDVTAGDFGLYVAETTVDIINSSITAPNDHDVHLGTASSIRPALIRALNTTFNQSSTGFDNTYGRLNVSWFAEKIWVEWQNVRRVPFADVWIENVQSQVVFSSTTDVMGEINWLPVQDYTQNITHRTDYTRHNFSAEKNGVSSFAGATMNQNRNIRIILQDNVNDPEIDILNPIDGGIYNTSIVWANGTALDPESGIWRVEVWPEGLSSIMANGTEEWGTNVTLPDGEWTLTVNATNYAGVMKAEGVTITVDTVEPDLTVDYPAPVDLVNTTNITVSGTTEPGAFVTVNGLNAIVQDDGGFSLNITLPEGINTVIVASHDVAMNFNFSMHTVEVDITPPSLIVSNPPGDIITVDNPLVAVGWVEIGANLTLNGVEISHPGEPWALDVTLLEGLNRLQFKAVDAAGNPTVVVRDVIYDTTPPDVNVTFPPDEHLTNETVLTLDGWTEDLTLDLVTVNGENVTVELNGNFSLNITLSEGLNEIEVVVRDQAGHMTIVRKKVFLDTIAPPLEVFQPMDQLLTNNAILHVIGTTELSANVTVNGVFVTLEDDGTFDHTMTLTEGTNVITVLSRDPAGNPTIIVRTVDLDTQPPELKVSAPKKGDSFKEVELTVKGQASDNVGLAKVTINGKEVPVKSGGKFTLVMALKDGSNKIVVEATDTAGNVQSQEITVTREGLTALESGLLATGIVLLIVGFLVGMLLGRGRPKKGVEPSPLDETEPEERGSSVYDDGDEEGPEDEPEDGPKDGPEEDGPDDGPEDEPKGPPKAKEDAGPEKGQLEDRKAESEMPPDDSGKGEGRDTEKSLEGILKKLSD